MSRLHAIRSELRGWRLLIVGTNSTFSIPTFPVPVRAGTMTTALVCEYLTGSRSVNDGAAIRPARTELRQIARRTRRPYPPGSRRYGRFQRIEARSLIGKPVFVTGYSRRVGHQIAIGYALVLERRLDVVQSRCDQITAAGATLFDELIASDQYLVNACETADVFEFRYLEKRPLPERLGIVVQETVAGLLIRCWERGAYSRFFS